MPKRLRIGLAGAGYASRFHVENFRETGVDVVGVTSPRPESRQAFAGRYGVRAYASVAEMLPEIDVLDICSPPSSHRDYILQAAAAGKHIIVEKPLTGFYGSPEKHSKQEMLEVVAEEARQMREHVARAGVVVGYAENCVYAPAVQKEREVVEKSKAMILRLTAEESHSGSHSPVYGIWAEQGGGSLIGKGCHPLGAVLYLKRKEGLARLGRPIRPVAVTSRTHSITRLPGYEDRGFLRTTYKDTEDYGFIHVIFDDGTVGDIFACELVLGGVYEYVEVFANNHRTRCNMSPSNMLDVYSPSQQQLKDVYLLEKVSSNEGWIPTSADEGWSRGYRHELGDFVAAIRECRAPESDLELAIDTTLAIYAAYVSADEKGREIAVPHV